SGYYDGFDVTGDNGNIQGNIVNISYDGYGIYATGDKLKIMSNTVQLTYYTGIYVTGDFATIQSNNILAIDDDGIYVSGDSAKIISNVLQNTYGGIEVGGASTSIQS